MGKKHVIGLIILLVCVYISLVVADRVFIQKEFDMVYMFSNQGRAPGRITFPTELTTLFVPEGTTVSQAYAILGKPQRHLGSGLANTAEWDLLSGNTFRAKIVPQGLDWGLKKCQIVHGHISYRQLIVPGILVLTALGYIAIVRHNQRIDKAGKRLEDVRKDS